MRSITLWPTTTERREFRLYDSDLRQLLRLPVRRGEIKNVTWVDGRLSVVFEKISNKKFTIK